MSTRFHADADETSILHAIRDRSADPYLPWPSILRDFSSKFAPNGHYRITREERITTNGFERRNGSVGRGSSKNNCEYLGHFARSHSDLPISLDFSPFWLSNLVFRVRARTTVSP